MRLILAAINCWVPHAAVRGRHINFRSNTTFLTVLRALLHLLPHRDILLNSCKKMNTTCNQTFKQELPLFMKSLPLTITAIFRFYFLFSFVFHLLGLCVINVRFTLSDHFLAEVQHQIEIVGGVCKLVRFDLEECNVF